jgi:hypothetical protein
MSGDATETLSRRAHAPAHPAHYVGVQPFRDAREVDDNPWGWVDFGDDEPMAGASFDEQVLRSTVVDENGAEFWGAERRPLLDDARTRLLRQAGVVVTMVAVLGGLLWLADRTRAEADQTAVVAAAAPADTDGTDGADGTETAQAESTSTGGLQSSSVEPGVADGVDGAQALANAESAIVELAEGYRRNNQTSGQESPAADAEPTTTAAPAPTAAPATTTPPTTSAPTSTEAVSAPEAAAPVEAEPAASEAASVDQAGAEQDGTEAAAEQVSTDQTGTEAEVASEASPTTTAHPDGWVDAGHGVFVPPVLLEIRFCESRHDYTAANPSSSARGAYQFLRGSWADYGHRDRYGVTEAHLATPAQQDEAALITWQRSGTTPWNASKHCWG